MRGLQQGLCVHARARMCYIFTIGLGLGIASTALAGRGLSSVGIERANSLTNEKTSANIAGEITNPRFPRCWDPLLSKELRLAKKIRVCYTIASFATKLYFYLGRG